MVIRSIVQCLTDLYEVPEVYGIKWGYCGFYENFPENWIRLDSEVVKDIHKLGGTILGSSRGGFNADEMCKALRTQGIS